jgi:hypothetical protein
LSRVAIALKFLNSISILAEFDDSFREIIPSEYQNKMKEILENQNKFHNPKNKKEEYDDELQLLDEHKYWSSDDDHKKEELCFEN